MRPRLAFAIDQPAAVDVNEIVIRSQCAGLNPIRLTNSMPTSSIGGSHFRSVFKAPAQAMTWSSIVLTDFS